MSFYYLDGPPEKPSRWGKYIPRWLRTLWADIAEVLIITRLVFSIILPVLGVLIGFVLILAALLWLLSLCSGGSR